VFVCGKVNVKVNVDLYSALCDHTFKALSLRGVICIVCGLQLSVVSEWSLLCVCVVCRWL